MNDKLYRDIFNVVSAAIAVLDADTTVSMVNDAFCLFSGYTKEELIGTKWTDKFPPEEVKRLREYNRKRILGDPDVPNEFEVVFITKGNKLRTAFFSVSYLKHSKKTIIYAIDVTDKKDVEERLRLSEFFFEESQRAANIGSYKANFISGYWESSEVLDNIFGIDKDYDKSINTGWVNLIHPDDREYMQNYLQHDILVKHKPYNIEYRIIRKSDGKIRWVNGLGKIILDKNGQAVSIIGTIQDITNRKIAEQAIHDNQVKLNIALKVARLGSWELNLEENLFHFNDTFYAIFGTNTQEVGGNTMTPEEYVNKFMYPEDYEMVRGEIEKAIKTKDANYTRQIEHRMVYANGEMGYVAVRFAIAKDSRGKTVRVFGINQDITVFKNYENQLKENEAGLLELNKMKDKFFSIIAHDLQSPFSTIMGFSELLVENAKSKNISKVDLYSTQILNASKMAMDLLANLMEWSRSETGRLDFTPQNLLLLEIVKDSVELLKPTSISKQVTIDMNIPADLYVNADLSMLSTILRNLISNAIKFSFTNGKIDIVTSENEDEIIVEVSDNGIGMPEKQIKKLFRIDENVSTPGTEDEQGTGLGLILCKEFVEKHGGRIWVTSDEGKGSTFYFSIAKQT